MIFNPVRTGLKKSNRSELLVIWLQVSEHAPATHFLFVYISVAYKIKLCRLQRHKILFKAGSRWSILLTKNVAFISVIDHVTM